MYQSLRANFEPEGFSLFKQEYFSRSIYCNIYKTKKLLVKSGKDIYYDPLYLSRIHQFLHCLNYLQTPSPLHSPCIYAAFRVKEHPSPAFRWFTTPSPNGQGMFETKKLVKLQISKFLTF